MDTVVCVVTFHLPHFLLEIFFDLFHPILNEQFFGRVDGQSTRSQFILRTIFVEYLVIGRWAIGQ